MKRVFTHIYNDIISVENLLDAWKEFLNGKRSKEDVLEFQSDLIYQVISLHEELRAKTYKHGSYYHFRISDPKPRDIHKASVRDRLLHHAIYRKLYPYFDTRFIHDSYSCRQGKGTHRAMRQFFAHARKGSHNHTKTVWVLKCDIRKFFASIDHTILFSILEKHIKDTDVLWLLHEVVESFSSKISRFNLDTKPSVGLPLGNLTSQLLVNIYMNEFDQYVKHTLKVKYYIRYADDFVVLTQSKQHLQALVSYMVLWLRENLKLELHPQKCFIKTFASGVDFLGWVHFPTHRVLRTSTKRRMLKRIRGLEKESPTVQSYLGMLKHGNGEKLKQMLKKNLQM